MLTKGIAAGCPFSVIKNCTYDRGCFLLFCILPAVNVAGKSAVWIPSHTLQTSPVMGTVKRKEKEYVRENRENFNTCYLYGYVICSMGICSIFLCRDKG